MILWYWQSRLSRERWKIPWSANFGTSGVWELHKSLQLKNLSTGCYIISGYINLQRVYQHLLFYFIQNNSYELATYQFMDKYIISFIFYVLYIKYWISFIFAIIYYGYMPKTFQGNTGLIIFLSSSESLATIWIWFKSLIIFLFSFWWLKTSGRF